MSNTTPKKLGRKPSPEPQISITTLKGSARWAKWLKRLAEHDRNTLVGMIDRAAAEYAASRGFPEPPPPRFGSHRGEGAAG